MITVFMIGLIIYTAFRTAVENHGANCIYVDVMFAIFLGCTIGFRDVFVGSDTYGYIQNFLNSSMRTFSDIFAEHEQLYYALTKLIREFTKNYTVYLTVFALIFSVSYTMLIAKESKNLLVSYVLLFGLGYMAFFLAGIRQTTALGILLWSYRYLKERKLIPFLLVVLLAYFFHNSAIIFLLAYPISTWKFGAKHFVLIILAMVVGYLFQERLLEFINFLAENDRLQNYENRDVVLSLSGYVIKLSVFIFCSVFYKQTVQMTPENKILYNLCFLGVVFQGYTILLAEFFRISIYFSIFETILLANVLSTFPIKRERLFIVSAVLMVVYVYFYFFLDMPFYRVSPNVHLIK